MQAELIAIPSRLPFTNYNSSNSGQRSWHPSCNCVFFISRFRCMLT